STVIEMGPNTTPRLAALARSGWRLFKLRHNSLSNFWSCDSFAKAAQRERLEQGFAAVALLIFVSGILVVVLVVWRELFRFAAVEDRAYRACVLHVWRAQDEQRKLLTKLLRLNPAADRLRVQRRQAEL